MHAALFSTGSPEIAAGAISGSVLCGWWNSCALTVHRGSRGYNGLLVTGIGVLVDGRVVFTMVRRNRFRISFAGAGLVLLTTSVAAVSSAREVSVGLANCVDTSAEDDGISVTVVSSTSMLCTDVFGRLAGESLEVAIAGSPTASVVSSTVTVTVSCAGDISEVFTICVVAPSTFVADVPASAVSPVSSVGTDDIRAEFAGRIVVWSVESVGPSVVTGRRMDDRDTTGREESDTGSDPDTVKQANSVTTCVI